MFTRLIRMQATLLIKCMGGHRGGGPAESKERRARAVEIQASNGVIKSRGRGATGWDENEGRSRLEPPGITLPHPLPLTSTDPEVPPDKRMPLDLPRRLSTEIDPTDLLDLLPKRRRRRRHDDRKRRKTPPKSPKRGKKFPGSTGSGK